MTDTCIPAFVFLVGGQIPQFTLNSTVLNARLRSILLSHAAWYERVDAYLMHLHNLAY